MTRIEETWLDQMPSLYDLVQRHQEQAGVPIVICDFPGEPRPRKVARRGVLLGHSKVCWFSVDRAIPQAESRVSSIDASRRGCSFIDLDDQQGFSFALRYFRQNTGEGCSQQERDVVERFWVGETTDADRLWLAESLAKMVAS